MIKLLSAFRFWIWLMKYARLNVFCVRIIRDLFRAATIYSAQIYGLFVWKTLRFHFARLIICHVVMEIVSVLVAPPSLFFKLKQRKCRRKIALFSVWQISVCQLLLFIVTLFQSKIYACNLTRLVCQKEARRLALAFCFFAYQSSFS